MGEDKGEDIGKKRVGVRWSNLGFWMLLGGGLCMKRAEREGKGKRGKGG